MRDCCRFFGVALILIALPASAFEPRSSKDCRLAFLLGMSSTMRMQDGWESLPEDGKAELCCRIARAYAVDVGATPDELSDGRWRVKVLKALEPGRKSDAMEGLSTMTDVFGVEIFKNERLDVVLAYIAGAFAYHGTPTGFRLVDQRKGMYLMLMIRNVSALQIDSVLRPGIPGNFTITLSRGSHGELEDFFSEMQNVREALLKN